MTENTMKKQNTDCGTFWLIITYAAAATMVVQCRSIWMHLRDYGPWVNRSTALVLGICLMALAFKNDGEKNGPGIRWSSIKTGIIIMLYLLLFVLLDPVNYRRLLRCGLLLCSVIIFLDSRGGKEKAASLLGAFRDVVVIVAGVSVVCWFLLSLLHLIPYPWSGSVYVDWSDNGKIIWRTHFMYIYYETQWFITGYVARNSAIFVEGPMANYLFSLAFMTDFYIQDSRGPKAHRRCRIILALAMLTTFTATGWFLMALMWIMKNLPDVRKKRRSAGSFREHLAQEKKMIVLAAMVLAFVVLLLWNKTTTESSSIRMDDIRSGFKAWLSSPLWGVGFENTPYIARFASPWRLNNLGYSNSPVEVLAEGGLMLFIPYGWAILRGASRSFRSGNYAHIAFEICFLVLFAVTIIPYQYITMLMVCMLMQDMISFRGGQK